MYRALKTKKVLGFVIGALVIIGLVGIVPRIAQADNPRPPSFYGYAYDENGNLMPPNTPVVARSLTNPDHVFTSTVKSDGTYEIFTCNGCQYERYVLNYGKTPVWTGNGLYSPPANVDINPATWEDFSDMVGY